MVFVSLFAAHAGPLGPLEDGAVVLDTSVPALSACDTTYPFDLVPLPPSDFWAEFVPEHAWGSPTMVEVLTTAAERLALLYPDSPPLLVGDIARENGGDLPPHRTHGDGRSADIGLFGWRGTFEQLRGGFPRLAPKDLDLERTWTVIDALLATGRVEHILLDQRHIDRLKAWLLDSGRRSPEEVAAIFPPLDTPRLWSHTGIVRHAVRHEDHLHVRVSCDDGR